MDGCNISDKVVVVTGGAGLLGKEFVMAVANSNGVAIIADLNEKLGVKTLEDIRNKLQTDRVEFVKLDITSKKSINHLIEFLVKKYGKVDAIVNSAYPRNQNYGRAMEDVDYKDFCDNVNMHLGGYFLTSQQFGLYFKKQKYGNIINIASIYGVMAPRFEIYNNTSMSMPVEYSVIKSAIVHLTKYFAKYYKGHNIRVNCISPGGLIDKQPGDFIEKYNSFCLSKGMLDKGDVIGTLMFLLSNSSQYINGQNIIVDDGFSL